MKSNFLKSEEVQELLKEINALFLNAQQPPESRILDDVALCEILHISPRTTSNLRRERKIAYSQDTGKVQYLFSDVLAYLKMYRVEAIYNVVVPLPGNTLRKTRKGKRA